MTGSKRMMRSQAGLTLIELLVAMVVTLVLLGGVHQLFVGSTTSYSMTDQLSRVQENGRFATHILRKSLLDAGFLGCLQDVSRFTNALNNPTYYNHNYIQGVYGLESTGTNTWADASGTVDPTATGAADMALVDPRSGSDILILRGVDPDIRLDLTQKMAVQTSEIHLETGLSPDILATGGDDILLITDCEGAAVFQTTGYTNASGITLHAAGAGTPGNSTQDLGHAFSENAQVFVPQTVAFFVRNNPDNEPSLFRKVYIKDSKVITEELVEGVESMQVRYGEDINDDRAADIYRTATAVVDWGNVMSVRIGLLMRSADEILHGPLDTSQYDIDGDGVNDFDPVDDRRLRLIMSNTAGIRNRLR